MEIEPSNNDPLIMASDQLTPRELYTAVCNLRQFLILRLNMEGEARRLQAAEYERRLEVLNHDREEAREKSKDYIAREQHDLQVRELEKQFDLRLRELEKQHSLRLQELEKRIETNATELITFRPVMENQKMQFASIKSLETRMQKAEARISNMLSYVAGATFILTVLMLVLKMVWK